MALLLIYWSSWNFARVKNINKKMQSSCGFFKIRRVLRVSLQTYPKINPIQMKPILSSFAN